LLNIYKWNTMSEIIEYIKRPDVKIIGFILIVLGILAGVFKQYWFIAGVNTMSKKKLNKIDMDCNLINLCIYGFVFKRIQQEKNLQ